MFFLIDMCCGTKNTKTFRMVSLNTFDIAYYVECIKCFGANMQLHIIAYF